MSKLFKLKQWLTIEEAAIHLTTMLGEQVSPADVLRLALDGHLQLAVNFVNHARGRKGKIVAADEVEWREFPADFPFPPPDGCEPGKPFKILKSLQIGRDRFINLGDEISSLDGVWDLMMIGGEALDVEQKYQMLTGGAEVTLINIEGAFVQFGNLVFQLLESYEQNEYMKGSLSAKSALEFSIISNGISSDKASELRKKFNEERALFLEEQKTRRDIDNYYPSERLPEDSVLVVRTSAIIKFLESVDGSPRESEKPLSTKERQTLLVLIAAICKQARLDWGAKGVSTAIAAATEEIGAPVTDDTIRKILKQIGGALESRSK